MFPIIYIMYSQEVSTSVSILSRATVYVQMRAFDTHTHTHRHAKYHSRWMVRIAKSGERARLSKTLASNAHRKLHLYGRLAFERHESKVNDVALISPRASASFVREILHPINYATRVRYFESRQRDAKGHAITHRV